jgi:hypothetical protein
MGSETAITCWGSTSLKTGANASSRHRLVGGEATGGALAQAAKNVLASRQ